MSPPEPARAEKRSGGPCLSENKGQESAKRALEVAAAGGHNLLFSGPPGSGKSLLASSLPGILPDLTPAEALEVSMFASVAGSLEGGKLLRARPYRAPHHSDRKSTRLKSVTNAHPLIPSSASTQKQKSPNNIILHSST